MSFAAAMRGGMAWKKRGIIVGMRPLVAPLVNQHWSKKSLRLFEGSSRRGKADYYLEKDVHEVYNKRFEDMSKRFEDMSKRFEDMGEHMGKRLDSVFAMVGKRIDDLVGTVMNSDRLLVVLIGIFLANSFYIESKFDGQSKQLEDQSKRLDNQSKQLEDLSKQLEDLSKRLDNRSKQLEELKQLMLKPQAGKGN